VGNILRIKSVKKEDRGTYYCVADNGVSKGDRRNINVEVEFAPVITVPRPRLGQALQYDMDLECHIEAYPPPAIVWTKDDIQLANNQHYIVSHLFMFTLQLLDAILPLHPYLLPTPSQFPIPLPIPVGNTLSKLVATRKKRLH